MKRELNPRINEAQQGKRALLFVDASHFVLSVFLGYLWSFSRIFIKSPAGRQRFNVLGALNAVTHDLISVTNESYINAECVIKLMGLLLEKYTEIPITLVLDNARYQKCYLVTEFAQKHGIELLFLPAYSPNLNLIERLWRLVKKECLYCKYYDTFASFKNAIIACLTSLNKDYKNEMRSLMTLKFQVIKNAS